MVAVCLIFFDNFVRIGYVTTLLGKSLKNLKKFSFFLFFKIDCFGFVLGNLSLIKRDEIVWIACIVAVLIDLF